ncbi:MAG: uroporphyrinogen decarboxylase family protein [Anaerolineaceae bacterium]
MNKKMVSHRERMQACLSGQQPDFTPVALWRHFPVDDQTPGGLAGAAANFQRTFDFDLIKVTSASSFCVKDWGAQDVWRGSTEGTREYSNMVIQDPSGWERLPVLDPLKGTLGQQVECLRLLRREFNRDTPLLQTIFNPLSQAKNLVGKQNLLIHLRRNPEMLHRGLEIITETTLRFLDAALKTGIDGIFYAVQHAQYGLLTEAEFEEFSRPYDLRILERVHTLWLNILHLHGQDVMFKSVSDYPIQVINWHDRLTWPSLAEAGAEFRGVLCGGLSQWETMTLGTPDLVESEAREAIAATGGKRFILGTGCVLPITAPYGNIIAARKFGAPLPTG